jgi:L-ascorbate metabolism protein UlaG (beta-lactamase superfamily)
MRIRWYDQSAFLIDGGEQAVFIDPFGSARPANRPLRCPLLLRGSRATGNKRGVLVV